jgi:hypothetical protein
VKEKFNKYINGAKAGDIRKKNNRKEEDNKK